MSKSWEVDPETRTKLLAIQKTKGNDRCCDCGAPSPQWASPKFGTFICLNCAGIHRGLGVHISFVRSITMDAFKVGEVHRMDYGGNESWKEFFNAHALNAAQGRTFDDSTVKERYEGEVGDEWKARLSAKVDGREYVPGEERSKADTPRSNTPLSRRGENVGNSNSNGNGNSNGGNNLASVSRSESPARRDGLNSTQKEKNEAYFARMGEENASRSEDVPPSQGGKYGGFGGGMPVSSAPANQQQNDGAAPGIDEFQKDPMAALTKGFGWFTTTVGKSAKTVNDSYIQPTAHTVAQSEFASHARFAATEVSRNLQTGARSATEQFNRFVEGSPDDRSSSGASGGGGGRRVEPERKDFWDEFSSLGDTRRTPMGGASGHGRGAGVGSGGGGSGGSGAIGTSAMKKTPSTTAKTKKDDDWDDNW